MMSCDEAIRLAALRERLYRCVEDELDKGDGHHKSDEGVLEVTLSFPDIFHRSDQPTWTITWNCYVVFDHGRSRSWSGKSLTEALAVAEAEAERICFPYEMARIEAVYAPADDAEEIAPKPADTNGFSIEALAESWASIDGRLKRYRSDDGSDRTDGTRDGYNAEAAELIKRLNARGYDVTPLGQLSEEKS